MNTRYQLQRVARAVAMAAVAFPLAAFAAAPSVTVTADPDQVWPPNGKPVVVTVSGTITDTGTGVNFDTVSYNVADEYASVQPAGQFTLNPDGTFSFTVTLTARRYGSDRDGRVYTITVLAADGAGVVGGGTATVTVPHDRRGGGHGGGNGHSK
ncbi:MAG: hypothetical protein V1929_12840 [bacterium]